MARKSSLDGPTSYAWAGGAFGLMLLGRWSPDRLFDAEMNELFWVAKIAALLLLTLVVAMPTSAAADRKAPGFWLYIVLIGYVLASFLWTPVRTVYSELKLGDLAYNVVLVGVVAAGLCRPHLRAAFWPMLLAALGLMAAIGVIMAPTAIQNSIDGRLAVLGGGPNIFGRNMGILIVACVFFGLNFAKFRIICAVIAAMALIGLIASGSRGALGATLVALLLLVAMDPVTRSFAFKRPLIIAAMGLFGAASLLFVDLGIVAEVGNERYVEQTLQAGYLSMRDVLFQWAYSFWLEAPIFGNGLGSFALVTSLEYPHNILMEFLCETGAVGFLGFLLFAGTAAWKQLTAGGPEKALILALATLVFVSALVSGDFVDSRFVFLFLLYPVSMRAAGVRLRFQPTPPSFQTGPRRP